MLFSFTGMVAYIVFAILSEESFGDPEAHFVTAVWAFMTLKWSFGLWLRVRRYWLEYRDYYFDVDSDLPSLSRSLSEGSRLLQAADPQ
mmetsp:Transcript_31665/g.88753  ORF Transcript_31665/g.88753 Transcript_31665/m.88753 type:complete len:88 (+) Transcript_31665:1-264(+)